MIPRFALLLALLAAPALRAATLYVFDNTAFQAGVTGVTFTNALQVGGSYTSWSTNGWAYGSTSNYLGTIPSYAGHTYSITSTIPDNLSPPVGVAVWVRISGGAWMQDYTNVPVELAIVGLGDATYAIDTLEVLSFVNAEAALTTTDARNQTILVDTPDASSADNMVATKKLVDDANDDDSRWSLFPALHDVDIDDHVLLLSDTWELASTNESTVSLYYAGQPMLRLDSGMLTGLAITNWTINSTSSPPVISLTVSNGANQWPVALQYTTNLYSTRWRAVTNAITWSTNGSALTAQWAYSLADEPRFIRAVQMSGFPRGIIGSLVVTNLYLNGATLYWADAANGGAYNAMVFGGDVLTLNADLNAQKITVNDSVYLSGRVSFGLSGPVVISGADAPSTNLPNGSLYLRTDGTGPNLYVRENAAWVPMIPASQWSSYAATGDVDFGGHSATGIDELGIGSAGIIDLFVTNSVTLGSTNTTPGDTTIDAWTTITVGGTAYRVPLYLP